MKKLVFLFAMVLAVSMAMAQHTDVVNETGNNNTATVDQSLMTPTPGLEGNTAYVDQIGNGNIADVDQLNNGYASTGHSANVWSQGDVNYGKVFQENASGDAIIYQYGNTNYANIFQSGNFGVGAALNPLYDAFASQIGSANVINITLWGTDATAYAQQVGNNNAIDQDLGSAMGEKVEDSHFSAQQFGNGNIAIQMMQGEGFETPTSPTAINNNGIIYQQGDSNYAIQNMWESVAFGPAANNYANAYQYGNSNYSAQSQVGDGVNSSIHSQIGSNNSETTNQN